MVILIAGSSHTGKTLLAQKLLEKFNRPFKDGTNKKWKY